MNFLLLVSVVVTLLMPLPGESAPPSSVTKALVVIDDPQVLRDGCHGASCRPERMPSAAVCTWHQLHPDGSTLIDEDEVDAEFFQPAVGDTMSVLLDDEDVEDQDIVSKDVLSTLFSSASGRWTCALRDQPRRVALSDEKPLTSAYVPRGEYRFENTELSCASCLRSPSAGDDALQLNFSAVNVSVTVSGTARPLALCLECRLDYDLTYESPTQHKIGLVVLLGTLLMFVGVMMWTMISGTYRKKVMSSHVSKKFDDLQQWINSEKKSQQPAASVAARGGSVAGMSRRRRQHVSSFHAFDVGQTSDQSVIAADGWRDAAIGGDDAIELSAAQRQELFERHFQGGGQSSTAAVKVNNEVALEAPQRNKPSGDTFPIDGGMW